MPWRCPACRTEIRHDPGESRPSPTAAYRCHVCRLDLRFDAVSSRMEIAPLHSEHTIVNREERNRTLPTTMPTRQRKSPTD